MGIKYRNTDFINLFGDPDRPIYGNEIVAPVPPTPTPSPSLTSTPSPTPTPTPTPSTIPFTPDTLSDLMIWYDFNDISEMTYDGSNLVSQVNDKSGNGYDITASGARRPLLITDTTYGGNYAVEFSGATTSTERQALQRALGTTHTGITGNTLFVVWKNEVINGTSEQWPWALNNTGRSQLLESRYFENTDIFRPSYPGMRFNSFSGWSQSPYFLTWQTQEPGSPYATIDGDLNGNPPSSYYSDSYRFSEMDHISIGGRTEFGGYANPLKGNMAEFIVYERVLSPSEVVQVVNYLEDKWNYVAW